MEELGGCRGEDGAGEMARGGGRCPVGSASGVPEKLITHAQGLRCQCRPMTVSVPRTWIPAG